MKIDIRTGHPFSGDPPKRNHIVSLPTEKNEEIEKEEKNSSQIPGKIREVRKLLQKPLKERTRPIEPSSNSLAGHINRFAKFLHDQNLS